MPNRLLVGISSVLAVGRSRDILHVLLTRVEVFSKTSFVLPLTPIAAFALFSCDMELPVTKKSLCGTRENLHARLTERPLSYTSHQGSWPQ